MGHERSARGTAEEEFADFVFATQRRLRLRRSWCAAIGIAEDIVQTALTQVYPRWERIRPDEGPPGYVRRAVVNAAVPAD